MELAANSTEVRGAVEENFLEEEERERRKRFCRTTGGRGSYIIGTGTKRKSSYGFSEQVELW